MMQAVSRHDLFAREPALSYRVKVMYGVGEIANAIKVVTFGLYSLFYATVVQGLPGTWIGVIGFIAMMWDALIDPVIGHLTDGAAKRQSFMLAGAATMGVGYWAFFSPPRSLSTVMLVAWLLAANILVRTSTSMYSIPYYAVGANLSQDYHERTSIAGIRSMASAIGTLLTASLSFVLFFPERVPGVDPKLAPAGYASMGLTFGLVMTVTALIGILGALPQRHSLESGSAGMRSAPRERFGSMWESLRNPSVRVVLISFSLFTMGTAVNSSLLLYYLKYYVRVSGSVALSSSQGVLLGAGFVGTIFWLRVSRKFDKHRLCVFSAAVTAALMLAGLVLFGVGHPLGTGDARPLFIGYGLAGFSSCILWFVPQSMLADLADESELITGSRHEGALFGMFSFSQQMATGVAVLLAGGLLDRFVRLVPGELQESSVAVYRIGIVHSVVPAALFIAAAIIMLSYKLTRLRVDSIQAELRQRRLARERRGGE